jgi:hypothetical protein
MLQDICNIICIIIIIFILIENTTFSFLPEERKTIL